MILTILEQGLYLVLWILINLIAWDSVDRIEKHCKKNNITWENAWRKRVL